MPSRRSRLRILPKELRTSDRFTDVHGTKSAAHSAGRALVEEEANSDTAKKFVPGEIVLSRLRIQPLIAEIRNTPGSKRLNVDRCGSRAEMIAVRPSRPHPV